MLVTASWGGAEVAVELDAECRSVDALRKNLQEALPELDVEAVRLEVCGRAVDDEEVLELTEGSLIDITATQAALAAATLREEGCDADFDGFCHAAEQEDLRLCRLYLEAGVVWPPGVDTPLHIAAKEECCKYLKTLLDADETNAMRNRIVSGLRVVKIARLLLDREDNYMVLHYSVLGQHVQLTKLFLNAGCDKDAKAGENGDTPLHTAISMRNMELVELLLDAGCDKDATNDFGSTPLHAAVNAKNVELTKLLLDAGCDKNVKNSDSATPLQTAIHKKHAELAQLIDPDWSPPSKQGCCVLC